MYPLASDTMRSEHLIGLGIALGWTAFLAWGLALPTLRLLTALDACAPAPVAAWERCRK